MNPFANEEIMWQRLKDLQREAENSRLLAQSTLPTFAQLVGRLAALALRRSARQPVLRVADPDRDGASRVA